MSKTRHLSKHHFIPSSRIPRKLRAMKRPWNIMKKSVSEHRAWHFLFNNRLACEAINMIAESRVKKYYDLSSKDLDKKERRKIKLREKCWRTVFGDTEAEKAIEIIKQYWASKKCFNFEECNDYSNCKKFCPLLK